MLYSAASGITTLSPPLVTLIALSASEEIFAAIVGAVAVPPIVIEVSPAVTEATLPSNADSTSAKLSIVLPSLIPAIAFVFAVTFGSFSDLYLSSAALTDAAFSVLPPEAAFNVSSAFLLT